MSRDDLELYAMGEYEGDVAALEDELAGDTAARATVADEARFELLLRDAAAAATFCPACDDLVRGARCDACGVAVRPGGYVVERVLVSNAHGRMYAARDADGKQVALKELAFVQSPTVEVIAAFEREVKFLRALDHPAIPRFCASFEEGAGVHVRYYLAQELVTGESLADRLDAHWYSEAEIVGIARQVLDVLVYLQALTPMVIHRDIKPANLVVRADGVLAVVDFGAAHVQGMTVGSTVIGTFGYMPIEQLAGEVNATTDPYALGASLLHLVTRKEPWRILHGGTLSGLELNLSRPMRAWLGKLVAPQPRDRFRSAAEARAALDRLAGGRRWIRSALTRMPTRSVRRGLLAAAAVAAIGAGGTMAWLDSEAASSEAQEPVETPPSVVVLQPADRARASSDEARASATLTFMSALRELACRCTDKRCIDDVTEKISRWSNERTAMRLNRDAAKHLAEVSAGLSRCIARVLGHLTQADQPIRQDGAGDPVLAGGPAPGGARSGDRRVELKVKDMLLHDAVLAIAEACDVNVVLSAPADDTVRVLRSPIPCNRALETLMQWIGLEHKSYRLSSNGTADQHIYRIAAPTDAILEQLDRDARSWAGDNAAGLPRGDALDINFHRAPLRDVIRWLATRGHIDVAISESLNSTVTVYARHASWNFLTVSVLDTTHLGFHYDPATRRLEIPPPAEPHR